MALPALTVSYTIWYLFCRTYLLHDHLMKSFYSTITEFTWSFLHLSRQFHCTYIQKILPQYFIYWSNFIYNYDSFYFELVLSTLLFIVMFSTSILLAILNSGFWLNYILIFHFYYSNCDFISEIKIIIFVPIVTPI